MSGLLQFKRGCNVGPNVIREDQWIVIGASQTSSFEHSLHRNPGHHRNRLRHNRSRGLQIFLKQHGRQREHICDIIEPMPGIIGGKLFVRVEVDTHEITHRVAILHAIQSANGHAARIGVGRVDGESFPFDPIGQNLFLFLGRLRLFQGRHHSGLDIFQGRQPKVLFLKPILHRLELIERNLPLFLPIPVAIKTKLLQNGLNLGLEGS